MSKSFLVTDSIATVYADAAAADGFTPTGVSLAAATDGPHQLAEGAVGIWTVPKPYSPTLKPQLVLPGTIAALLTAKDVDGFQFVIGRPASNNSGNAAMGPVISRKGLTKYVQTDYSAPVQQLTVVGADGTGVGALNFPATIVAGMVFSLGLVLTRHGSLNQNEWGINQPHERLSFEYVAKAADEGALDATRIATILQGWIDDLTERQAGFYGDTDVHNYFTFAILDNAGAAEGLSITVSEGRIFEVFVQNEAEEATIQYTDAELGSAVPQAFNPGVGTGYQVYREEMQGESHSAGLENINGINNRFSAHLQQNRVIYSNKMTTYDTFMLTYINSFEQKDGMGAVAQKRIHSALALPVGSAAKADLITILDAIFDTV